MKNRSSYAVLTRFGIIAAILATLVLIAPAATAQSECEVDGSVVKCDYLEGGEEPVATFTAEDFDADAGDIDWSLSGVDKDIFKISDDGALTFDKVPDFETPKDADESEDAGLQGFEDNVYKVTVQAAGGADTVVGTQKVEVTVTDKDEDGSVSFDKPQPQVGRGLVASFSDDDTPLSDVSWQWSRGPSMDGPWTEVGSAAATGSRNPVEGDIDSYLLATVTYTDRHGSDKTASKATDNAVEARTVANAAPDFGDVDAIEVDEGVEGAIGDPVVAEDADDIHLLYSIVADGDTDDEKFSIGRRTGQLSLKEKRDFENAGNRVADTDATDDIIAYTVRIKAEDPSGAFGEVTVTVNLKDVNEAPTFEAPGKDQKTLYIAENATGLTIFTNEALDGAQSSYTAADQDAGDDAAAIRFSLEGDDDNFAIDTTATGTAGAPLTADADFMANHEKKSEYKVTIVATSGGTDAAARGDRGEMVSRLEVTIKVVDSNDVESVTLSSREPQVGIAVLAELDMEYADADIETVTWKWFRGATPPADDAARDTLVTALTGLEDDPEVDPNRVCGDDAGNTTTVDATADGSTACVIAGATSALYTPVTADAGHTLHAVATYNDKFNTGTTRANALGSSEKAAQVSDPANTAPKFPDQDLSTAGDQSDVAMRSVKEGAKDEPVGAPLEAEDSNGDLLTYSLSGTDADSFKLDDLSAGSNSVQILTAVKLDFETQTMHEVVLQAMDPSGATDSITVMIEVTDVDEGADIMLAAQSECEVDGSVVKCDYLEGGEEPVATFTAEDFDADAGDIDWSLSGVDKDIFKISDDGALTFDKVPDFETPKDADESEDAGLQGFEDNVYKVTVQAAGGADTVVGTQKVEVTVTDKDEDGSVSFDKPQPQVGRGLVASFSDDDTPLSDVSWQWSRGPSMDGPWTEVGSAAATGSRNPVEGDIDSYLLATVTYTDRHGSDKTASKATDNAVEARTVANAAPDFGDVDAIEVDEGVEGAIGDPVVAEDADDIHLLYSIVADGDTDDEKFSIGRRTGQLSLKEKRDFENAGNRVADTDATDDIIAYTVRIKAEDPSGAFGEVTVTVNLKDVNEAPTFEAPGKDQKTLYIAENATGLTIFTNEALDGAQSSYTAADQDAGDDAAAIRFSLEGDDDNFAIDTTATGTAGAPLTADADFMANHEKKSEYKVTIVATSGGTDAAARGDRGEMVSRLEVTIKVVDSNDVESVTLSSREPQVGIAVLAELDMEYADADIETVTWKWFRGATPPADDAARDTLVTALTGLEDDPEVDPNRVCGDDAGNTTTVDATADGSTACVIAGATSALYTPVTADAGHTLHAVATYNDKFNTGTTRANALGSSEKAAQVSDPANTAPKFPDQDLSTAGDQSDVAMRSVKEGAKDEPVGAPLEAEDSNGDLLTYSLSGTDADSFKLDDLSAGSNSVQILTAVKLDFETQTMHEVVLQAMDPSGATDSITVMIEVTDVDEGAKIELSVAPEFADDQATEFSVAENSAEGEAVGTVAATDANDDDLTYSLGGDDAMYFAIDDMGQITVGEGAMLDYETKMSYSVTVTADDGTGFTASIDVTIMLTDVNEAPMFDAATAERMVDENMDAGTAVGDPVTAMDEDGDDLMYTISESMYFGIDAMSGQISTTAMLDYEAMASHEVTVTATDGDGLYGMIAVTIMVGDVEESPCVIGGAVAQADSGSGLDMDCQTLLGIMDDLVGDGTAELNWSADLAISEWQGVAAGTGRVTGIYLRDAGLAGVIPSGITALDALERLTLTDNDLGGDIPDLNGLDSIQWLVLGGNAFTGGIPASLGDLDSLIRLWLHRNDGGFEGGIPPELGGLPRLRYLMLHGNGLTGEIPSEIGNATNLKALYLHDNMLSGSIPASLGNLMTNANDTIRLLYLHNNMLTGDVPAELGNLTSLTGLRLSGNMLTGCIPAAIIDAAVDAERAGLMACADDGS